MPATSRGLSLLAGAILVLAVVIAYANTFQVPFLMDDQSAIVGNTTIIDLKNLGAVLSPDNTTTTSGRPLLNLTFALNHAWGGQVVAGYHAVNLVIHLLAALTLFGVVRRTLCSASLVTRYGAVALPLGFFIALLWAVHPLLTGAVTYLSQRAESLMGLFYLLTLYAFIRSTAAAQPARWAWLSAACCLAGMMTKEVMMTAPVIVLLYDRGFCAASFKDALAKRRWYYMALALTWILLAYLMVSSRLDERDVGLQAGQDWWFYALTEFKVVVGYAKLALWPSPLVFDYGQEILVRKFLPVAPYALLVLAALAATVFLLVRGRKELGFVAAAGFILLSPTSSFVPVMGQPMAESRMYLPLAAVVTLVVIGLYHAFNRAAWYVLGGLAVILCILTVTRNEDYRSVLTIYEDTIRKHPDNFRGHYNLASELGKIPGRAPEAIAHYEAALRLKPDLMAAHLNLANELAKTPGREGEALGHYEAALRLQPDLVEAHTNAARLLAQVPGRLSEALAHYEEALRLRPDYAVAHNNLANELAKIPGRAPEALAHYEAALRLKPELEEAHNNLANELAKVPGRLPEAIAHYEEALRLKPDYAEAHCNLANKLARIPGRLPEALAHYETALRLRPDFVEAHYNYANRLANLPGRLPEAVTHYEAALRLNPNLAEAHKNLALAFANLGQFDEAIRHLKTALALNPAYAEARDLLEQIEAMPNR